MSFEVNNLLQLLTGTVIHYYEALKDIIERDYPQQDEFQSHLLEVASQRQLELINRLEQMMNDFASSPTMDQNLNNIDIEE